MTPDQAIDEVRFQLQLNEARANRFTSFSALILAAGVGLVNTAGHWSALVFILGSLTALLGWSAVATGHQYYRRARDQRDRVLKQWGITEPSVSWWRKCNTAQSALFLAEAIIGLVAAITVLGK